MDKSQNNFADWKKSDKKSIYYMILFIEKSQKMQANLLWHITDRKGDGLI